MEPTGLWGGGGERELPRVDPGEAWGGRAVESPYGYADFPHAPPVYLANKAIADILPPTYGCGQMTISGTTWSWNH